MVAGRRLVFPLERRLLENSVNGGSGEMLCVDLRCNEILRRFEFAVDFVELDIFPPFLHKTLTSISSLHFSEFCLEFWWEPNEPKLYGRTGCSRVWGTGLGMVDGALYAHADGRDGFRFVVEIAGRQPTVVRLKRIFRG